MGLSRDQVRHQFECAVMVKWCVKDWVWVGNVFISVFIILVHLLIHFFISDRWHNTLFNSSDPWQFSWHFAGHITSLVVNYGISKTIGDTIILLWANDIFKHIYMDTNFDSI